MKNFLLVLFLFISLAVLLLFSTGTLGSVLSAKQTLGESYFSTDLGFVLEEKDNESIKYKSGDEVVGECMMLLGGKERLNQIQNRLGLLITKKYFVDDKLIIEGVSNLLPYRLSGRQENIQISYSNGGIVVGSPIIYGSY